MSEHIGNICAGPERIEGRPKAFMTAEGEILQPERQSSFGKETTEQLGY